MPVLTPPNRTNPAGSGFTNLQRILQANKSNRLGQTVSSGVQQAGQAARGAISQAGQQFQEGVGQERTRLGSEGQRVDTVLGNIPGASDDDISAFQGIRSGQSKGPKQLENAQELQRKAEEAEYLGKAGGSEAGRFGLLQRYVGRGQNYGGGQQRLDNLLLGQTGQPQLRQARAATSGLGASEARSELAAQEMGKQLQGEANQLKEATIGKLKGQVTDYDTAMQKKLSDTQASRQAIIDQLTKSTGNAPIELDENVIKQLSDATGHLIGERTELFNTDLNKYFSQNLEYANKQAAQEQADFDKAKMIAKLSGQDLGEQGAVLEDYTMRPELIGQFAKSNMFKTQNLGELENEIRDQRAKLQTETGAHQKYIDLADRFINRAEENVYSETGGYSKMLEDALARKDNATADFARGKIKAAQTDQEVRRRAIENLGKEFGVLRTIQKKPPTTTA